ncbi:Adenylate cyclase 1 (plasmid) [Hartmannibacter diazotrophicus]|uniref:Adenylate cyclase 1 n=1 Tax=Hartmannibacter diazotrophicus TaxID=1482074 RepID=A0A2C9DE46_9HYPH|nr:adenylate/guanylate cyclase domain-containing protein [Hartmannibacter diazotrophicus]SON58480.1 Adenylate cyclase 1 [Hartmannibacter diazotrophicus]
MLISRAMTDMKIPSSKKYKISQVAENALAEAQRHGFRLAIIGRTIAIVTLSFNFLAGYHFPVNIAIWLFTLTIAISGLLWLKTADTRLERLSRFASFFIDAIIISIIITFAPLSSGDDIPQNLVFFTARDQYYFIVISASILTLSPSLVLFTGGCCALGLALSTAWIKAGMPITLTFADLPLAPSREIFYSIVLNPNFFGMESRIEQVLIIVAVTIIAAIAIYGVRSIVLARVSAEETRGQMQHLFGKYVPATVIADLQSDGQLAPQLRDATLLFADIEGFTALSEKLPPADVVKLLNEIFAMVSQAITMRGGLIVNYFGDAVMASFNAPLPLDKHALNAVMAARDITEALNNSEFLHHRLRMRIGIASGPVAAGTVGSEERLSFTLYGDTVNVAQRLEALNKEFGTNCLISEATYSMVCGRIDSLRPLGMHSLRNRLHGVNVYSLELN